MKDQLDMGDLKELLRELVDELTTTSDLVDDLTKERILTDLRSASYDLNNLIKITETL